MSSAEALERVESGEGIGYKVLRYAGILLGACCMFFFATLPLTWPQQAVLGLLMLLIALWLSRASNSYLITLTLMIMSMFATFRYGWWRVGTVVDFFRDPGTRWGPLDAFFILILVGAEAYAFSILFLGFMQTIWPLRRAPVPLPDSPTEWPHVDLLIPTYNEPLSVVRYTALASLNIDWPADKLHVYILDDGKREEFRRFAEEAGVGYMTRDDNHHAKAGNINRALERLDSPYVAIFDSDHVPTRSFLQVTMGWFLRDRNLAMMQTPHHFYSPDPFERNLSQFRVIPNEGELFYGIVQDGNDFWNATFFCGSCAVLRREALDQIGGIAVETVTEDAHTSLRMQMNGWNTAYINIPQAAGLATERLSGHVKQRIRWARGMVQILRTDNPLTARGLKFSQRLCYFNAMTHFMYALPRLIFLTAPLIYLLLSRINVPGYWAAILAYALPHLTLSNLTNSRIQGQHRHSFWNEIYETVLSPYILLPTMMALVNPKLGKFNVTAKGGIVSRTFFDARIAQPFVVLLLFNILGLIMVIPRSIHIPLPGLAGLWDGTHPGTIVMNAIWTVFNIVILGVATAVSRELVQRRQQVRIDLVAPVRVKVSSGILLAAETIDVSSGGVSLTMLATTPLPQDEILTVIFQLRVGDAKLPARVIGSDGKIVRLQFEPLTIVEEEMLTMVLYSRADTWLGWGEARENDQPLRSLYRILELSMHGLRETFSALALGQKDRSKKHPPPAKHIASLILLALLASGSVALAAVKKPARIPTINKISTSESTGGTFKSDFTLKGLGVSGPMELRGIDGSRTIDFALPRDQVVRQAKMHLVYHFSPSLLPQLSQMKVMLNGSLFAVIQPPAVPGSGDTSLSQDLAIPSDLLVRNNQLTFEFIGHYVLTCEDPANTVLWARIDPASTLSLTGQLLPLADDLKFLPLPFFDSALSRQPSIAIVFPLPPSQKALQAAGIVASYFGMLADYRATRFPVTIGALPSGNVVLIAESPAGVPAELNIGNTTKPTLAIRANPKDPYGKVLVVTGADSDQLLSATQALAMKWNGLQERSASVLDLALPKVSEADSAPRWAQTDQKIQLWDYSTADALQGDGSVPLQAFFRIPPDLYYADKVNARLHLDYLYNPIPIGPSSSMQVHVNNSYLGSVPLIPSKEATKQTAIDIAVPIVNLRPFSNSASFNFTFQLLKKGGCTDTTPINMQGAVLRSSYLDLRGFSHWATLPNLELFANAGFPFTRYSDLSQTTVVLPDQPTQEEIELYLTLMGHFGAQTGYPVLRVAVENAEAMKDGADRDFLVIGTGQDNSGVSKAGGHMPVTINADSLTVQDSEGFFAPIHRAWWKMKSTDQGLSGVLGITGSPDVIIEGFESPYFFRRSIVVIHLKNITSFGPLIAAFLKTSQSGDISGTVSVLHGTEFQSFRVGNNIYHVGVLPWWTAVSLWFEQVPWMVAIGVLFVAFIFAVWTRTWLRGRARARLQVMEG